MGNDNETRYADIKLKDNYEEGDPCPKCGSTKISVHTSYEMNVETNLSTGKIMKKDKNWDMGAALHWEYECRKCKWVSNSFVE